MRPLSDSASATLRVLLAGGVATRPELADRIGLSKQTVSLAVAELERRGLVADRDVRRGRVGRSPVRYGLAPAAGWVAGVDLGATRVKIAAAALDGTVVAESTAVNPGRERSWDDAPRLAAVALAAVRDAGPLRSIGVAVDRPVEAVEGVGAADPRLAPLAALAPAALFAVENDVNCAALAQAAYRPGAVPPVVLHLQVGAGVGAAVLVDGHVVRGRRGRAGELARLPVAGRAAEDRLGAAALLAAAGEAGADGLGAALDSVLARAAAGEPAAVTAIEDEAEGIADLVDAGVALLDPDLIVLAGAVGEREAVRTRVLAACAARGSSPPLVGDPLGDGAAVLGAVALATDRLLAVLAPARPPHGAP